MKQFQEGASVIGKVAVQTLAIVFIIASFVYLAISIPSLFR